MNVSSAGGVTPAGPIILPSGPRISVGLIPGPKPKSCSGIGLFLSRKAVPPATGGLFGGAKSLLCLLILTGGLNSCINGLRSKSLLGGRGRNGKGLGLPGRFMGNGIGGTIIGFVRLIRFLNNPIMTP
jgi:hypothetical protein